jgi:hypothetical protein
VRVVPAAPVRPRPAEGPVADTARGAGAFWAIVWVRTAVGQEVLIPRARREADPAFRAATAVVEAAARR